MAHPERPRVGMVWAQTPGGAIAADGELPWDVPEDFQHFRDTVADRPVIAGRATWESMPAPWRRGRAARSVVVTRDPHWHGIDDDDDALRASSLPDAIEMAANDPRGSEVWIMGGGQIYALGMAHADVLLVSEIDEPEPAAGAVVTPAPGIDPAVWVEVTPESVAGWRESRTGTRWRVREFRRREQ